MEFTNFERHVLINQLMMLQNQRTIMAKLGIDPSKDASAGHYDDKRHPLPVLIKALRDGHYQDHDVIQNRTMPLLRPTIDEKYIDAVEHTIFRFARFAENIGKADLTDAERSELLRKFTFAGYCPGGDSMYLPAYRYVLTKPQTAWHEVTQGVPTPAETVEGGYARKYKKMQEKESAIIAASGGRPCDFKWTAADFEAILAAGDYDGSAVYDIVNGQREAGGTLDELQPAAPAEMDGVMVRFAGGDFDDEELARFVRANGAAGETRDPEEIQKHQALPTSKGNYEYWHCLGWEFRFLPGVDDRFMSYVRIHDEPSPHKFDMEKSVSF